MLGVESRAGNQLLGNLGCFVLNVTLQLVLNVCAVPLAASRGAALGQPALTSTFAFYWKIFPVLLVPDNSEGEALCGHMTCESFDALCPSVRPSEPVELVCGQAAWVRRRGRGGRRGVHVRAASGVRRRSGHVPATNGGGDHRLSLEAEAEKEEGEGGVRPHHHRIPTHAHIPTTWFFVFIDKLEKETIPYL